MNARRRYAPGGANLGAGSGGMGRPRVRQSLLPRVLGPHWRVVAGVAAVVAALALWLAFGRAATRIARVVSGANIHVPVHLRCDAPSSSVQGTQGPRGGHTLGATTMCVLDRRLYAEVSVAAWRARVRGNQHPHPHHGAAVPLVRVSLCVCVAGGVVFGCTG